jgi:hypothetical protein
MIRKLMNMLKLMYHSKLMEKKLNNHQKLEFIYDF